MPRFFITILFSILGQLITVNAYAQSDTDSKTCFAKIDLPYVSDGQSYITPFLDSNFVRFDVVFYENVRYRIMVCDKNPETVFFSLEDTEGNIIFSGDKHKYPRYWDFTFESTMRCYIKLYKNKNIGNPEYGAIAIGYKQDKP